jgi:hypothetical protein
MAPETRKPDVETWVDADIDQFAGFLKLMADEKMFDSALAHMKSKGWTHVRISYYAFTELQQFLRSEFASRATPAAGNVHMMCSKNSMNC